MSEKRTRQFRASGSEQTNGVVRMNTDAARKDTESDMVYHIYSEFPAYPPSECRVFFDQNWANCSGRKVTEPERAFLLLHCQISEVPPSISKALEKAAAIRVAYGQNIEMAAADEKCREDIRKQGRKDMENMDTSMRFEECS